jgi:hypothetical protein
MLSRANSLENQFAAVPLSRETLDEVLAGYRRPNDKVSEWMRTGALESLRRGLYLTGEPLRQAPACLPLVANHLYGPSCVSLDYALAWHGLIPEGVVEVTSVTPRPRRILQNARGRFIYLVGRVLPPAGQPHPTGVMGSRQDE